MKGALVILLIIGSFPFVSAQTIEVLEDSLGYTIEITIEKAEFIPTSKTDSIPVLKHATYLYEKGAPDLLKLSHKFNTDKFEGFKSEVLVSKSEELTASIAPSLGLLYQDKTDTVRVKGDIYSKNTLYPNSVLKAFEPYTAGKIERQVFWFYPYQYNPVSGKLIIHTYLKIRLHGIPKVKTKSASIEQEDASPERMLILSTAEFSEALKPFVAWKNKKGIQVDIQSVEAGLDDEYIKTLIANYHAKQEINYLLLVGDHPKIPAYDSQYGLSDYSYGLLKGNDQYVDIKVGRFPAKNVTELSYMIQKSLEYEQGIHSGEWLETFAGLASNESGSDTESDAEHIAKLCTYFEQQSFVSKAIYQGLTEDNLSITELFNNGCGYMYYIGHGNYTKWVSNPYNLDSMNALRNYNKHPFLVNGACLVGDLSQETCFAEKIMTCNYNNKPTGAVATLSSTISQLWVPPMYGQDIIAHYLFNPLNNKIDLTLGTICNIAYYEIIDEFGGGGRETAYTWMLYGDPSLELWTTQPQEQNLGVPSSINISADTFYVDCPESTLVSLMCNDQLIDAKLSQNGVAALYFEPEQITDSVVVSYSKQNQLPLSVKIPPYDDGGSYYSIVDLIIADNNNRILEPGEEVEILPVVVNFGQTDGLSVELELTSLDSVFEILSPTAGMDVLLSTITDTISGLSLRVKDGIPDGYIGEISLKVSDSSGQANVKTISLRVNAPELHLKSVTINGVPLQEDLVVDKDTLTLECTVVNAGMAGASDIWSSLDFNNVLLNELSLSKQFIDVPALDSTTFNFQICIHENCVPGWHFKGDLKIGLMPDTTVNLSLFYKSIPEVTLGSSSIIENEFPFYNYYKSGKTQILYTAEELGAMPVIIDSIGLNIASVPFNALHRSLENFNLSVAEVDIDALPNSYLSGYTLQSIFDADTYIMPSEKGWFFIDIEDYQYSGSKNLLLELTWGKNIFYSNYNDSYTVYSHLSKHKSTAFGYDDFKSPPNWKSTVKVRPDIRFSTKLKGVCNVAFVYENTRNTTQYDSIYLKVNNLTILIKTGVPYVLEMVKGEYNYYLLNADKGVVAEGLAHVEVEGQTIMLDNANYVTMNKTVERFTNISYSLNQLQIRFEKEHQFKLLVIDYLGRKHFSLTTRAQNFKQILKLKPGGYLIYVQTDNNQISRKKILVF